MASPTTHVHLVRHGEVHNPDGVLYGRLPDFHLSDLGRRMAERVAEYLVEGGADVAHVVASPLERAQETAAPTATAYSLPVHTDQRLIEAGNLFEGLQVAGGRGLFRRPQHVWLMRNPLVPSWGEPFRAQVDRMLEAADDAREVAEGREAVLVSHQSPIWLARCGAEGRRLPHDPRRRQCTLASITTLVYLGADLVDVLYREPCADLAVDANPVPGA